MHSNSLLESLTTGLGFLCMVENYWKINHKQLPDIIQGFVFLFSWLVYGILTIKLLCKCLCTIFFKLKNRNRFEKTYLTLCCFTGCQCFSDLGTKSIILYTFKALYKIYIWKFRVPINKTNDGKLNNIKSFFRFFYFGFSQT